MPRKASHSHTVTLKYIERNLKPNLTELQQTTLSYTTPSYTTNNTQLSEPTLNFTSYIHLHPLTLKYTESN